MHGGFVCQKHGGMAPQVKRCAEERLKDLIDPDRALRELARLAYSDPAELFDESGALKPIGTMAPRIRHALAKVKVTKHNLTSGDGKQEDVVEVSLWDKPAMLRTLLQHLGLLTERVDVGDSEMLKRLMAGRLAAAGKRAPGRPRKSTSPPPHAPATSAES